MVALRYLTPTFVVQLVYFWKFRALVSSRSEVQLSRHARWGRGCVISSFTKIKITGPLHLGQRVQIGSGCFLGVTHSGLYVGDDVMIGQNSTILTSNLRYDRLGVPLNEQGSNHQAVRIGKNVWIGANSVVLPGTVLGDDVIVSAGSVVSGVIPPNSILQGNPARVVFTRR
jgi:acetyltransferase-like isoleucine patch superfamily enzyme